MNDGRIAASREIVEIVTRDNFNLVWATIDWSIRAGRFRLPPESVEAFRLIPHESQAENASLQTLNDWMVQTLRPETRRRIFADIRRAQFEAAKGAVQITISEETHKLLRGRKRALFGPYRGSMEVTIRHLLDAEQCALPRQAFRLLEAFRQRHNLSNFSEAVRILIDHVELAYQAHEVEVERNQTEEKPAPPPQPLLASRPVPLSEPTAQEPAVESAAESLKQVECPVTVLHPAEPVWNALIRCWMP
ncbi:MAG: hypothetical protein H7836_08475 [Magnetococcus sp. YQC-3]